MSSQRCIYCGKTFKELFYQFQDIAPEELICSCCEHCIECKLLTKTHKNETTVIEPSKVSDYFYT